ncbi:MAG: serine hydrolase domain-containing protein [Pseudomonadota bacterium]
MRITAASLLLLCAHAFGNDTVDRFEAVSQEIYERREGYTAFGSYITIVQNGETAYTSVNGVANAEHQVPVSEDTVFDLASIAKTVTGYAIAELEESGALSTDDDIRKYLPDFPDYGHTITVGHLVHHTSGIKNWTSVLWDMRWPYTDRIAFEQIVRMAHVQKELNFVPGTKYQYSNTGYVLLAAIVEAVTGESFADWTKDNVFAPLSMDHTFFKDDRYQLIPHLAGSYFLDGDGNEVRDANNTTALGSSSLISNGTDMRKWMNFLMSPPPGKRAIVTRMLTTKPLNDGSDNSYAYGIDVGEYRGTRYITHSGSWASHTSQLVLLPDLDTSLFIAHNFRTNTGYLINRYVDTLLPQVASDTERENSSSEPEAVVPLSDAQLDAFPGIYRLGKAWVVTISREGNQLFTRANGEGAFSMKPIGDNVFRIRGYGNRTMTFNKDATGDVISLAYNDIIAPKIALDDEENAAAYSEYEGVYYNLELELMLHFQVKKDDLYANSIRHGNVKLISVEEDLFIGDGVIRSVKFSRDDADRVSGFHVTNSRGEHKTAFVKASR